MNKVVWLCVFVLQLIDKFNIDANVGGEQHIFKEVYDFLLCEIYFSIPVNHIIFSVVPLGTTFVAIPSACTIGQCSIALGSPTAAGSYVSMNSKNRGTGTETVMATDRKVEFPK
jgi:hypothetical protein